MGKLIQKLGGLTNGVIDVLQSVLTVLGWVIKVEQAVYDAIQAILESAKTEVGK